MTEKPIKPTIPGALYRDLPAADVPKFGAVVPKTEIPSAGACEWEQTKLADLQGCYGEVGERVELGANDVFRYEVVASPSGQVVESGMVVRGSDGLAEYVPDDATKRDNKEILEEAVSSVETAAHMFGGVSPEVARAASQDRERRKRGAWAKLVVWMEAEPGRKASLELLPTGRYIAELQHGNRVVHCGPGQPMWVVEHAIAHYESDWPTGQEAGIMQIRTVTHDGVRTTRELSDDRE